MFKEFRDAGTGKRVRVQYDHVFVASESQNGGTQVIAAGGASVQTQIPYAEFAAWLDQVDAELDSAIEATAGAQ